MGVVVYFQDSYRLLTSSAGKRLVAVRKRPEEETHLGANKFPEGWDETRVKRVIEHYERQTEDDAVAENEAGVAPAETVMSVPRELVAQVRDLIAKHSG